MKTLVQPSVKNPGTIKPALVNLGCALLVLLFSYTALSKWTDPGEFRWQLANQDIPGSWIALLFWLIPGAELLTCILLLGNRTRWFGLVLSLALLLTFTIYIALLLAGARERMPCACGGVISGFSWTGHFLFNIFFTAINILALRFLPAEIHPTTGEAENL
jgi:putative oxidoreductase